MSWPTDSDWCLYSTNGYGWKKGNQCDSLGIKVNPLASFAVMNLNQILFVALFSLGAISGTPTEESPGFLSRWFNRLNPFHRSPPPTPVETPEKDPRVDELQKQVEDLRKTVEILQSQTQVPLPATILPESSPSEPVMIAAQLPLVPQVPEASTIESTEPTVKPSLEEPGKESPPKRPKNTSPLTGPQSGDALHAELAQKLLQWRKSFTDTEDDEDQEYDDPSPPLAISHVSSAASSSPTPPGVPPPPPRAKTFSRVPPTADGRQNLLDDIRTGKRLKHVEPRVKPLDLGIMKGVDEKIREKFP